MSPIVGMLGLAIFEPALWNCLIAYLFFGSEATCDHSLGGSGCSEDV